MNTTTMQLIAKTERAMLSLAASRLSALVQSLRPRSSAIAALRPECTLEPKAGFGFSTQHDYQDWNGNGRCSIRGDIPQVAGG